MVQPVGYLIVGLFAVGMAFSFLAADPRSPTSRALALMLGLLGITSMMNIPGQGRFFGESPLLWGRLFSLVETGVLAAGFEWILRIGRTGAGGRPRGGEGLLRVAQGLACLHGLVGLAFPELPGEVWVGAWSPALLRRPAYYLFAVPFILALTLAGIRIVQLLHARLDHAELMRLNALSLATPFWCSGFFLPHAWKPLPYALGEVIFLAGAIRYHVLQGQRGQFLGRFLSAQVVRLVRERGLEGALRQSRVELSVVACDLRGFTAFTETAAPEEIMELLAGYYRAVGEVVAEFGGSINGFAGDGILVLVGAPIAYSDHARRAVAMALAVRERAAAILTRWRDLGLEIGLGVGVASGIVTVGVIGAGERLEYAAVGPAVNLAARLCSRAEAGQILTESRVVGSVGDRGDGYRFEKIETAELKGMARPVTVFAVVAERATTPSPTEAWDSASQEKRLV